MNQILTRAQALLTYTSNLNLEQIAKIISGLAVIAIVSMDLGVEYSKNETQIYTSFIFQVIAILAVAYTTTGDINMSILLLIICPPLAIFFKLGFLKGFISAIICGVLCVKLYYFPGLLFAILHVLC